MKKIVLLMGMILFGFLYHYLISVEVKVSHSEITISSKISQTVTFHLKRLNEKASIVCHNQEIPFIDPKQYDYFYHGEEEIKLRIKAGKTHCQIKHIDNVIKTKLCFVDFMVLFILWGTPMFITIFQLFIYLLERIRRRYSD